MRTAPSNAFSTSVFRFEEAKASQAGRAAHGCGAESAEFRNFGGDGRSAAQTSISSFAHGKRRDSAALPDLEDGEENVVVILVVPIKAEEGDAAVHHERH
jgi:hypothetical protein